MPIDALSCATARFFYKKHDFMTEEALRELLETLYDRFNRTEFIAPDPISVPHRFEGQEDREIAGFLAATIAWGNRILSDTLRKRSCVRCRGVSIAPSTARI